MVYISEAHARDEWPVGDPIIIDQPKTLSKRLEIAEMCGVGDVETFVGTQQ